MKQNLVRSILSRTLFTLLGFTAAITGPNALATITWPDVDNEELPLATVFPQDINSTVAFTGDSIAYSSSDTTVCTVDATDPNNPVFQFSRFGLVTVWIVETTGGLETDRVAQTFGVVPTDPGIATATLTFNDVGEGNVVGSGSDTTLVGTGPGGVKLTYTFDDPDVASISGNILTALAPGTVNVTLNFVGNATFAPANSITKTVTVKEGQTITFPAIADRAYNPEENFIVLNATSSSGLQVSYEIIAGDTGTIQSGGVSISGAGPLTIRATQVGDGDFAAATSVDRSFTVTRGEQEITFFGETGSLVEDGAISNKTIGDDPFTLTAITDSGEPVDYSIVSLTPNRPAVTLEGNTITVSSNAANTAEVVVQAIAPVTPNYNASPAVTRTFQVRLNQTITFDSFAGNTLGDPAINLGTKASSTSGNVVDFEVVQGDVSILPGTPQRLAMFGIGIVTLRGTADAADDPLLDDPLYNAVSDTVTFVVGGIETTTGPGFLDLWKWRNPPESTTEDYNGISLGPDGDDIVAVGDSGMIARSLDGFTWTTQTVGAEDLNDVASNPVNDNYVAVGNNETILLSTDGVIWSAVTVPAGIGDLLAVGYGGTTGYVAAAYDGATTTIVTSTTGADGTWAVDATYPGDVSDVQINAIEFSDTLDQWILAGNVGTIVTMDDITGVYTVQRSGPSENLYGIHTLDDGRVYIVGDAGIVLSTSDPNLSNWSKPFSGTDYALYDIFSGNGYLVAVGENGRVLTSLVNNGTLWTESVSRFPLDMRSQVYFEGLFISAGQNYSILTSATGLEWTQISSSSDGSLNDVAGTDTAIIAVGDAGLILRSDDGGDSWTEIVSGTVEELNGVVATEDEIIIVGNNGTVLKSSDDGLTWTPKGTLTTNLRDIAVYIDDSSAKTYVLVGESSTIAYSIDDGETWTRNNFGTVSFNAVTYANNRFVLVGDNGTIMSSPTGTTAWDTETSNVTSNLYGVAGSSETGDIGFVVVGADGTILTSQAGDDWATRISSFTDDLLDIVFADGVFVAVGERYAFVASEDGINWSSQVSGSLNYLNGVAFAGDIYIAVGDYGAILTADSVLPTGLDTWQLRNPVGDGENINDVVFGNNSFVAVGDNGSLYVSTDGENWEKKEINETVNGQSQPLTADLKGVAYGNGLYMAVGGTRVLRSTNAINWQTVYVWTADLLGISFGNSQFVITGDARTILSTVDGTSWSSTRLGVQPETGAALYDAAYSEELGFWTVAGDPAQWEPIDGNLFDGEYPTMTQVFTSVNGINWQRQVVPMINDTDFYTGSMRSVSAGFDVAGDPVVRTFGHNAGVDNNDLISYNGTSWVFGGGEAVDINGSVYTEGNGQPGFIYVGELGAIGGQEPSFITFPGITSTLNGIAFGKQTYIAVGDSGRILSSTDARSWSVRSSANLAALNAVVVNSQGKYVAIGADGTLLNSEDSISWTAATSVPTAYQSTSFFDVTTTDSFFVAVGDNGSVLISYDGDVWDSRAVPALYELYAVTYGDNTIAAVGAGGEIVTSPDGDNWFSGETGTTNHLRAIHYADGLFVAVGEGGTVLTSPDAQTWTARTSGTTQALYGVGYGEVDGVGRWLVVGVSGIVLTSDDGGATWTSQFSGTDNTLTSVSYGLGNFFVVGSAGTGLTSTDAEEWFRRPTSTGYRLNGATYFNGVFTAVGDSSTIITSGDIQPRIDQTIKFQFISNKIISDTTPFLIEASATSRLPVSFEVLSGPASIVNGNMVQLDGTTGEVTIRASQAGNVRYNPATSVDQAFNVREKNQVITFFGQVTSTGSGSISGKIYGENNNQFTIRATADSGLTPTFTVLSGPASVSNAGGGFGTVTLSGAGHVVLQAQQLGNDTYNPAEVVTREFDVAKGTQTITFPSAGPFEVGDPNYTLQAEASSGLTITYFVVSGPGTIVKDNELQFTGSGEIIVQASQAGDENYESAPPVIQSFTVQPSSVGSNWTARTSPTTQDLLSVNFLGQQFLASGNNSVVLSSVSSTTWTSRSGGSSAIRDIALGGVPALYVAVGEEGIPQTSTDGQNWDVVTSSLSASLNGITYGGGRFLAVGDGGFAAVSTDGSEWTEVSTGASTDLQDVIFANEHFIAVGENTVLVSDDFGSTWEVSTFSTGFSLNAIGYGNGTIVAVGDSFLVLTSTNDGNSWQVRPAAADTDLLDITYGSGRFVAVGAEGGMFTSSNAINWVSRDAGTTNDLNGVAFVENIFVSVGDGGVILTSGSPTTKEEQTINFQAIAEPTTGSLTTQLVARSYDSTNASTNLQVSFYVVEGDATISNVTLAPNGQTRATLTLSGNPGDITVVASQNGDSNFYAAENKERTLVIAGESQTLSDLTPPAGALSYTTVPITLSAESVDSTTGDPTGLAIRFALVSGDATVSGSTLTLGTDSIGTEVVVRAYNSGSDAYIALSEEITYNVVRETTSITFEKIPNKVVSDEAFKIVAQTSNGEDVAIRIISGSNLASLRSEDILDEAGNTTYTHTVTLQGGDDDVGIVTMEAYTTSANKVQAPAVTRSFVISRFEQKITFAEVGDKTFGDAPFNVNAVADSGGDVTLTLADTEIATLDTDTNEVTIKGAGTIKISARATYSPDFAYGPAEAELTVTVAKASQVLRFEEIPDQFATNGTVISLRARTHINDNEQPADQTTYPIVFSVVKGAAIVNLDNTAKTLTLTGVQGQVTIQAAQAGSKDVNAATPVEQSFAVSSFGKVPFSGDGIMEGSTYGNGRHVAVGQEGFIFRSTSDAEPRSWEFIAGPTTQGLYDVAFGNGIFAAVGFFGTVITSSDGENWTLNEVSQPVLLNSVAYGNGRFVSVSSGGIGYVSTNGTSWGEVNTGTINPLTEIAYGLASNGTPQFVAVGPVGTIVTSPDGNSWTVRNAGTQLSLNGVTYGSGMFVIVADRSTYLFSQDGGVTWRRRSVPTETLAEDTSLQSVAFGATSFRVVGPDGLILTATPEAIVDPLSDDLTSRWVKDVSLGTSTLKDISFGGDRFVTVGEDVSILISLPQFGLRSALSTGGGYRWSSWMGWLYGMNAPWYYHFNLGWLYVQGPESSMWAYSPDLGWVWTSKDDYPWIFLIDTGVWHLYDVDSVSPRYLYNTSTGTWESF